MNTEQPDLERGRTRCQLITMRGTTEKVSTEIKKSQVLLIKSWEKKRKNPCCAV